MAGELDAGYDTSTDNGSVALMDDLAQLLDETLHYEFHDFKNKRYATPKVELRSLLQLAKNIEEGKYDN